MLFIFNRADFTARVARTIVCAEPDRLFVVADGPRPGHPDDPAQCEAVRRVTESIAWKCPVDRIYADTNLGCMERFSGALDHVFNQVESAIILEDDILPDPSFFPYCQKLLERYRSDNAVMHISGARLGGDRPQHRASYGFSRFPLV